MGECCVRGEGKWSVSQVSGERSVWSVSDACKQRRGTECEMNRETSAGLDNASGKKGGNGSPHKVRSM